MGLALPACGDSAPAPGVAASTDVATDAAPPTDLGPPPPDGPPPFPGRLVVNEIVAAPAGGAPDWVELAADWDAPVALDGWTLVDADPAHPPAPLPSGVLAPGQHLVIECTDEPRAGRPSVPFKLGREDELTLAWRGATSDRVLWSEADVREGQSLARLPDVTGDLRPAHPTPGEANMPLPVAPTLFETSRLVPVELALRGEDLEALRAGEAPVGPLPATVNVDDEPPQEALVTATAGSGAAGHDWLLDFRRTGDGTGVLGHLRLRLSRGAGDPTHLRAVLAAELSRAFGVAAPAAGLARLTLRASDGGAGATTDAGLVTLLEDVGAEFPLRHGDIVQPGPLWGLEPPASDLVFRGRFLGAYSGLAALNEAAADPTPLFILLGALNAGDPEAYADVLDLEAVLRGLALQAVLSDFGGLGGDAPRFAALAETGRFVFLPVDLAGAFGGPGCDRDPIAFPVVVPSCGPLADRPLLSRLLAAPVTRTAYLETVAAFLDGPFLNPALPDRVLALAAVVAPAVADERGFAAAVDAGAPDGPVGLLRFLRERPAEVRRQLRAVGP